MKPKTIFQLVICTLLPIACCVLPTGLIAQTPGEWTWMHGDNTPNSLGVFGTQGVPNPANKPPATYEPCEWRDNSGNLWLFGGISNTGHISSLWRYDPTTNQWTWMKGPSAFNQNGVYGTQGVPSPANYPGSRAWGAITWTDISGNLWLFGGSGYNSVGGQKIQLNDLWKYNISTNEWTWMHGPDNAGNGHPGSYGIQGISSPTNLPPGRDEVACSGVDNAGNLWLYGGNATGANNSRGDLWKYNISTNEWTWMQGTNIINPPAVYGTQGVAAAANTPGGRWVFCSWSDLAGNLWIFGGGKWRTEQ